MAKSKQIDKSLSLKKTEPVLLNNLCREAVKYFFPLRGCKRGRCDVVAVQYRVQKSTQGSTPIFRTDWKTLK